MWIRKESEFAEDRGVKDRWTFKNPFTCSSFCVTSIDSFCRFSDREIFLLRIHGSTKVTLVER